MSVFGNRTAKANGTDPREFVMDGNKYSVTLDETGTPIGVTYFGGQNPTFIASSRFGDGKGLCSAMFVKAAEEAAVKTLAAVKAGTLERKPHTAKNGKTSTRWTA